MKRAYIFAIAFAVFAYMPVQATIINIPEDYPTIQQGINASSDGDTVLVQPGTFVENINFYGHNIVLGSLFFTTADTSYISSTIIDGGSLGTTVTFDSGENHDAAIIGFTIQNGNSTLGGGGIYCYDNSSPTISHNRIYGNYSVGGGGICCHHQCDPRIINNVITENTAQIGGGIHIQASQPTVINNTINYNQADMGGGISCASSDPIMSRNIIAENTANINGGGLYCYVSSNPTLINCTISENSAETGGAAFYINSNSTITNSILWANMASIEPGIYSENSLFVITYCDIEGGWEGAGNIDIDPLFRDPGDGDYHLIAIECEGPDDSPCIDVGWPAIADSVLDCHWGLGTTLCDLGAYGGGDSAQNRIINIPDDYATIQEGIAASGNGDTVLVHPGLYIENINFNGHNIVLGSLFLITGDTSYISSTIIDGDSLGPVVIFENGEDRTTVISGLTIQNGLGLGSPYWYGGGITCQNYCSPIISHNYIIDNSSIYGGGGIDGFRSNPTIKCNTIANNFGQYGGGIGLIQYSNGIIDSNVVSHNSAACGGGISSEGYNQVISNNTFVGNSASSFGGGMWLGGNLTVLNNTIMENSAERGGGIDIGADSALIEGNLICENTADTDGGGMYVYCSEVTVNRNIFYDNYCSNEGGGIGIWRHHPYINHNIIAGNHARIGGGISCIWGTSPSITNNTIVGNYAAEFGGGLKCGSMGIAFIENTIFWDDSANVAGDEIHFENYEPILNYCDVEGGWEGEGNIDCDPMFCYPDTGNFYLSEGSCCMGAGEDGQDIGALGIGCEATAIEASDDFLPLKFVIDQNYPNPFNSLTSIRYDLPAGSDVRIEIYDILGRRVETLVNGQQPAGYHQMTWNAKDASSGIYFYKIQAGEYAETKKMVLLR